MSCRYCIRVVATNGNELAIVFTMFVLIGILTICSAGFNHLVAVVKMGNWLISFNVYI